MIVAAFKDTQRLDRPDETADLLTAVSGCVQAVLVWIARGVPAPRRSSSVQTFLSSTD